MGWERPRAQISIQAHRNQTMAQNDSESEFLQTFSSFSFTPPRSVENEVAVLNKVLPAETIKINGAQLE